MDIAYIALVMDIAYIALVMDIAYIALVMDIAYIALVIDIAYIALVMDIAYIALVMDIAYIALVMDIAYIALVMDIAYIALVMDIAYIALVMDISTAYDRIVSADITDISALWMCRDQCIAFIFHECRLQGCIKFIKSVISWSITQLTSLSFKLARFMFCLRMFEVIYIADGM